MSRFSGVRSPWAAIPGLIMLAACSMQNDRPMEIDAYHVAFDTDSYSINPAGRRAIADVAAAVQDNDTAVVTVVGRADATGSPDYNKQLSKKRAIAVHDALVATGKIAPDRIQVVWTKEKPRDAGTANETPAPGDRVVDLYIR